MSRRAYLFPSKEFKLVWGDFSGVSNHKAVSFDPICQLNTPLAHITEYNVLQPSEDNAPLWNSIPFAVSMVKAVAISSQLRRYLSATMIVWSCVLRWEAKNNRQCQNIEMF